MLKSQSSLETLHIVEALSAIGRARSGSQLGARRRRLNVGSSGWPHLVPNGPRLLYQERNEDT